MSTFSKFLFIKVTRKTPGEDGKHTIWFQKPGSGYETDHKVSADKLLRDNCYGKLEIGKYYVVELESYGFGRGTHYVWTSCREIRDDVMWAKFFHSYVREFDRTKDVIKAYTQARIDSGYVKWKQKRIKDDMEDLFTY